MADIGKEAADLAALEEIMNGGNARMSKFSYDDEAYSKETAENINGVTSYDYAQGQNIPVGTSEYLDTSETTLAKGLRSQSSSLPRQLINHLLGRASFNLNKIHEWFKRFLGTYREDLRKNCNLWSPTTTYQAQDVCFTLSTVVDGENPTLQLWIWVAKCEVPAGNEPNIGSKYWQPSTNYKDIEAERLHVTKSAQVDEKVSTPLVETNKVVVSSKEGAEDSGNVEVAGNAIVTGQVAVGESLTVANALSAQDAQVKGTLTANDVGGEFKLRNENLADNAVATSNIQDSSITTEKLADNSVTGTKFADHTVTGDKLTLPFLLPVTVTPAVGSTEVKNMGAGAGVVSVTEGADGSRTLTLGTDDTIRFHADGTLDTGEDTAGVTMQCGVFTPINSGDPGNHIYWHTIKGVYKSVVSDVRFNIQKTSDVAILDFYIFDHDFPGSTENGQTFLVHLSEIVENENTPFSWASLASQYKKFNVQVIAQGTQVMNTTSDYVNLETWCPAILHKEKWLVGSSYYLTEEQDNAYSEWGMTSFVDSSDTFSYRVGVCLGYTSKFEESDEFVNFGIHIKITMVKSI